MLRHIITTTLFLPLLLFGQSTVVTGKVTEAATGSPIPFATVVFVGTSEGAITDFEGNFKATTTLDVDSIYTSYIGFIKRTKALKPGQNQIINFQLDEDITTLLEVVVTPGENPAIPIMKSVIANKDRNDKKNLDAYDYESYVRTELDLDNISENLRKKKLMSKVLGVLDSMEQIAGEDGKPVLPLMMSEAISRFYFRKDPLAKHENIIKTKVTGIGVTDGAVISQVIGSTYQEYNFYQNWLNIVGKNFVSPIAKGWQTMYEYDLVDSVYIDDDYCYKLDFFPKQEQDLAFIGTMWITKDEYALKQIDTQVLSTANLNFLEKIKIQQKLLQTENGPWLPEKTRVIIDFKPLTEKTAGFIGKFYVSNKDFVIDQPKDNQFYMNNVSLNDDARETDDEYWQNARHDSLTATEQNVYLMIDTLNRIPPVRNLTTAIKFISSGYVKTGPVDIGPYNTYIGDNDIEGLRLGMGLRTNIDFSNKWVLGGYFGYGFGDNRWKYSMNASYINNRFPWSQFNFKYQKEIDQIWLLNEEIEANSFFYSFSRFGNLTQPFLKEKYRFSYQQQIGRGFNAEFATKHEDLRPLFDFTYFTDETRAEIASDYSITEVSVAASYGKDEVTLVNDNQRISLGPIRFPLYRFSYTFGSDQLGGDFTYHKLKASVLKKMKIGVIGISRLELGGGYMFGQVPYTLLYNPIGNETPVFVNFAYNLMNFFEFSSDRFAELKYRHSFEGFLFNRIPLIKKLKWRFFVTGNALLGAIRNETIALSNFTLDANGNEIFPFRPWTSTPYVEVGYGIENIFKFFGVHAYHRLTYLDQYVSRFGLKFNISISL
ncbi:MAG: carboxypeptidase-like regulatory domain-containing protein [Ekhidna sp.]|nr:carboxypeptidase-like regulatory domain-containing protein [Ekhidna sp.]